MKRLLLVCALVACGSRSDLSPPPSAVEDAAPPVSTACTDALEPGAFTPVPGYCSDNSNRARAPAPQHPHIVWTQPIPLGGFAPLVDAQGNVYVGSVKSFDVSGNLRWSTPVSAAFGVLLPNTLLVEADPVVVKLDESTGTSAPTAQRPSLGRIAGRADDTLYVEQLARGAFADIFVGVSRVDASGATLWTEQGGCAVEDGDFSVPHDFVRRGDDLILVCNANDLSHLRVLEVDAHDAKVVEHVLDGGLIGRVALEPNGALAFFMSPDHVLTTHDGSLVTIDRLGNTKIEGPSRRFPSVAAVAADGTLIVTSDDGIAAIDGETPRWENPSHGLVFVDSASSVVVLTDHEVFALDIQTGAETWALPLAHPPFAFASGGPGRIYVADESALTLIAD